MGFLAPLPVTPKRWAIRRFLRRLPPRLAQDYGHRGPYTPEQVESTLRRHGIGGRRYLPYAQAIFCDPDHALGLPPQKAAALRQEVSDAWFGGGEYSYSDVSALWEAHGGAEAGGHHGVGHDGGGHH